LEDLKSRNGTTVNGSPITERVLLQYGDRIEFGHKVSTRFESADQAQVRFTNGGDDGATIIGEVRRSLLDGSLDTQTETKLKAVLEISQSLAGTVDLPSLFPKILDTLSQDTRHAVSHIPRR